MLTETAALKKSFLQRKFFALWKSKADQRRLSRRAERRRAKLAASIKAAKEKRRREEAEMAEIQHAQAFSKQLQEAQRRTNEEAKGRQKEKEAHLQEQQKAMKPPSTNPVQKAGHKRKMLANSTSQSDIRNIVMSPMHKRSRTLGSSGGAESLRTSHSLPARSPRASLLGSTNLRRSLSQKTLRQSLTQQRLDQTQTDYFRLKAHGLDPDTPLIPETAAQVAARKQQEEEHRQAIDDRVLRRPSSARGGSRSRSSTPLSPAQSAKSMPPPISIPRSTFTIQQATPNSTANEDPFLRQLREAREALSTDETWFKTHAAELEKEIEQQEDFRRSGSLGSPSPSNPSRNQDSSYTQSTNGFARSASGYEYIPPELTPGQTLSRTEERIRRTGARGLANKPIGGTKPIPVPVAMSRRTAGLLHTSQSRVLPHGRKRSIDEVDDIDDHVGDHVNINGHTDQHIEYEQRSAAYLAQQIAKKKQRQGRSMSNGVTMQAIRALRANPFDSSYPQDDGDEEELDDEAEESEETGDEFPDEQEPDQVVHTRYHGAVSYDDEEADAQGDYEDEGEGYDEDDDEEEDDQDQHTRYPNLQSYAEVYGDEYEEEEEEVEVDEQGIPLPPRGRQRSAASSTPDTGTGTGVGSTVDAAIELSD